MTGEKNELQEEKIDNENSFVEEDDDSILKEFFEFMLERKKFWLMPIIFLLLILGVLILFTEGSALAPFIYTIF